MLNIANDETYAIGFSDSINWRAANMWTEKFCYYYSLGYSVEVSANIARDETVLEHGEDSDIGSMVFANEDYVW